MDAWKLVSCCFTFYPYDEMNDCLCNSLTTKLPFGDEEFDHVHIKGISRGVPETKVTTFPSYLLYGLRLTIRIQWDFLFAVGITAPKMLSSVTHILHRK